MKTFIDADTVARVAAVTKPKTVKTKPLPKEASKPKRPLLKLKDVHKRTADRVLETNLLKNDPASLLMLPKKKRNGRKR